MVYYVLDKVKKVNMNEYILPLLSTSLSGVVFSLGAEVVDSLIVVVFSPGAEVEY